ncbi:hypothetical protein [Nostoc sp. 'Peltigera membranacea cyanobiont' N6]|uniref:hypothetical protein n=1 Tax=Nostoc sp. 'Peltigera membranacea cyanobiont' N6 TaxID=1261031 RepID=UPI0021584BFE|nr:hypothetical protein [Nostoc sp. 'Peltigera membranacea cyanobiont' N6]
MQDKEQLQVRLKDAFRGFDTPAGKMRVKMLRYDAASEGSGIFFHRSRSLGNIAIAMKIRT